MRRHLLGFGLWVLGFGFLAVAWAPPAFGQSSGLPTAPAREPVLSRDPAGKVTVRATRVTTPIKIDGQLQMRRFISYKNEMAYLTEMNPLWGTTSLRHLEVFPTFVDLEVPTSSRNLEIKPYGISRLTSDLARRPPLSNDLALDAGVDLKVGVTAGSFLDGRRPQSPPVTTR